MSANDSTRPASKTRQDGIRTVADIKARCRVDDETGCWVWAGAVKGGSARVWLPEIGVVSLTCAVEYISTGKRPKQGRAWVPTCGNTLCGNPQHRRPGTRGELFARIRPELTADHKARIGAGKRAASGLYSREVANDIRNSIEPGHVLAARHGMHLTHACRIRRGDAWAEQAASVFSWRPA